MKRRLLRLSILCFWGLVSCSKPYSYQPMPLYEGYQYRDFQTDPDPDYRQYYNDRQRNADQQRTSNTVVVPNSYHVGAYQSPVPVQTRDNNWVSRQNPQGYTIQLAEGSKASAVAGTLTRAPKRARMATVRSFNNGQAYFRGIYGSYSNYEDAQRALNALPAELQHGATIKRWSAVQQRY